MNDEPLSKKEIDVLKEFIPSANEDKEIARALGVALVTVKQHMANLRRKFGAKNRTDLALKVVDAINKGKIEL